MKRLIERLALNIVLKGIGKGELDIIPVNLSDSEVLANHARIFSALYDHGLEYVLAMIEAKTGALMRKFGSVESQAELCRLQGQIDAYLSVRDAVDTVIRMDAINRKEN